MRVNLLENKQNPVGRSARPRTLILRIVVGEQGNIGVEEFASGPRRRPCARSSGLVSGRLGEGEACDWGMARKPAPKRVAWQATPSNAHATLGSVGRACALPLHGHCVRRLWARRAESATMTGFFSSALGTLFRRSRRRRVDWAESRWSMGSRGVRLMRAVNVTV